MFGEDAQQELDFDFRFPGAWNDQIVARLQIMYRCYFCCLHEHSVYL